MSFLQQQMVRKMSTVALTLVGLCVLQGTSMAQTSVLTWHYDNLRSGADTGELVLTPANVNYSTFGKLTTKPVDGYVVAQPLYVPGVSVVGQGVHNVVFVATMHDSVYAFDADDSNTLPLWHMSIITCSPAGATTVPATVKKNVGTTGWSELGIVSTPVIDGVSGTIYLVAETYENSTVVHRLHALDIASGVEKFGGPVTIGATYTHNGVATTFTDLYQMNRPALLLANGNIFIAWGSNGNNNYSQGWLMSYSASTLQLLGAVTVEPGRTLASIWQKGAGVATDPAGNLYTVTSEGPYAVASNLSMSVVKFNQMGGLQLIDFFTPFNHHTLSANDMDLTGLLLLPDQPGLYPHELIGIGKEGTIYLLNRDHLGRLCTTCISGDTQIVQEIPQGAGKESGNPVYWNNTIYFTGQGVPVYAYTLQNGQLVVPPVKSVQNMGGGGHAFITSNGPADGILWFANGGSKLFALDAVTLKILYSTEQAPNGRDTVPPLAHFAAPIAANGKVFIGTKNSLVTYGLLSGISALKEPGAWQTSADVRTFF